MTRGINGWAVCVCASTVLYSTVQCSSCTAHGSRLNGSRLQVVACALCMVPPPKEQVPVGSAAAPLALCKKRARAAVVGDAAKTRQDRIRQDETRQDEPTRRPAGVSRQLEEEAVDASENQTHFKQPGQRKSGQPTASTSTQTNAPRGDQEQQ